MSSLGLTPFLVPEESVKNKNKMSSYEKTARGLWDDEDNQPKKDTVGKVALDLLAKDPIEKSPIELEREMHTDYDKNIYECVDRGKKLFDGDFFIVIETKKERLLQNVLRNYFIPRQTCPTPNYDQTVYHYHRSTEQVEFLWVVPSRDTCHLLKDNALAVVPEERGLLKFVLDFSDGTLFRRAQSLNGEVDTIIKGES